MKSLTQALIVLVLVFAASKDTSPRAQTSPSSDAIQTFPLPEPQADDAAISDHKKVLRAEIAIDSTTTVRFYEQPTSVMVYNSTVSVERGGAVLATYNVGSLIKHQSLRLVHAALLRFGDSGVLVCEYEGGADAAREGFEVVRFSPAAIDLHTLPLTDFGKIVVFKGKPEQVEIWSGLPDGATSNADERPYVVRVCHLESKGYVCGSPKQQPGRFSPGDIDDPGIEIKH